MAMIAQFLGIDLMVNGLILILGAHWFGPSFWRLAHRCDLPDVASQYDNATIIQTYRLVIQVVGLALIDFGFLFFMS